MKQRLPSLNLLKAFEAAGRLGSFKLAADELCVSPPAVSQQIKALEEYLGFPLFKRLNRALVLTDAGDEYLVCISEALNQISRGTDQLLRKHHQDVFRISCIPFVSTEVVAANLHEFQAMFPGLTVEMETPMESVDLYRNNIDVGVRYGSGNWPDVDITCLTRLAFTPICSPDTAKLLAGQTLDEVLPELTLYQLWGDEQSWLAWQKLTGCDFSQTANRVHFDSYQALLATTAKGRGIAMGALPMVASSLSSGTLVLPYADQRVSVDGVYAVTRENGGHQAIQQAFIAWLQEHFDQLQVISDKYILSEGG